MGRGKKKQAVSKVVLVSSGKSVSKLKGKRVIKVVVKSDLGLRLGRLGCVQVSSVGVQWAIVQAICSCKFF